MPKDWPRDSRGRWLSKVEIARLKAAQKASDAATASIVKQTEASKKLKEEVKKTSKAQVDKNKKTKKFAKEEGTLASFMKKKWRDVASALLRISAIFSGMFATIVNASPSLSGAFAEIGFILEEVAYVFGESLAPAVESVIPFIQSLADGLKSLSPEVQAGIVGGTMLAGVFAVVASSAIFFAGTLGALLGPVAAVAAAIVLLSVLWTTNFGGIRDYTMAAFGELVDGFKTFVSSLSSFSEPVFGIFESIGQIVGAVVNLLLKVYVVSIGVLLKKLGEFFVENKEDIKGFFETIDKILKFITPIFVAALDFMGDYLVAFVSNLLDVVFGALSAVIDFVSSFVDIFRSLAKGDLVGAFKALGNMMIASINFMIEGLNTIIVPIKSFFDALKEWDILPDDVKDKIPTISSIPTIAPIAHTGRVVPGQYGQEVLVLAQAGERILRQDEVKSSFSTIEFNLNMTVMGGDIDNSHQLVSLIEESTVALLKKHVGGNKF